MQNVLGLGILKNQYELGFEQLSFLDGFLLQARSKTLSEKFGRSTSSNNHQAALLNVFFFLLFKVCGS